MSEGKKMEETSMEQEEKTTTTTSTEEEEEVTVPFIFRAPGAVRGNETDAFVMDEGELRTYVAELCAFLAAHARLFDFTTHTARADGREEKAAHFLQLHHWERCVPPEWRTYLDGLSTRAAAAGTPDAERAWLAAMLDVQAARWERLPDAPASLITFLRDARRLAQPVGISATSPSVTDALSNDGDGDAADGDTKSAASATAAAMGLPTDSKKARSGIARTPPPRVGVARPLSYDEGPMLGARSAGDAALALMKQKKKYETRVLGADIVALAARHACATVVDVGAGKGYLTQWVQVHVPPGVAVVAVEGEQAFSESYQRRAAQLQAIAARAAERAKKLADEDKKGADDDDKSGGVIGDGDGLAANADADAGEGKEPAENGECSSSTSEPDKKRARPQQKQQQQQQQQKQQKHQQQQQQQNNKKNPRPVDTTGVGEPNAPVLTARVPLGVDTSAFVAAVRGAGAHGERMLLTGLHTCGDLAATIIRLFLHAPEAAVLDIVGCCYHHLTERPLARHAVAAGADADADDADDAAYGFPLSAAVRNSADKQRFLLDSGRHLGANVLPQLVGAPDLAHMAQMHSYRTAVEAFIHEVAADAAAAAAQAGTPFPSDALPPDPQPHHVGNMRARYADGPFGVYCVRAVKQLLRKLAAYDNVAPAYKALLRAAFAPYAFDDESLANPLAARAEAFYARLGPLGGTRVLPQVMSFAVLRNALGPVVEALVIADRLLYIREQCARTNIPLQYLAAERLFRPDISPRSFVIRAVKAP